MRRPAAALTLAVALGCAGAPARPFPPPPDGLSVAAAGEVLARCARALQAGRFDEAHALLSERWRSRTTPARLATDYAGAGPVAREAAARVLAVLGAGGAPVRSDGRAALAVGPDRAATLVAEGGGWRVDALE